MNTAISSFYVALLFQKRELKQKKKKILDMSDPGDFVNCSRRIRAKNLFEKQFFTFLFMLSHTNLCLSGNGIYQFIHFYLVRLEINSLSVYQFKITTYTRFYISMLLYFYDEGILIFLFIYQQTI